ncbi:MULTISPECIES: Crp/Fnr family transcriptional regulator [Geobacillus]|uniref:Crp/Fnr family transcriptional regulator n=1 Tax=Geobacillus TaxID=129337 RepID=UPI0009C123CC|nr:MULTISPECIES: Crp/Fnr family transcriptional regulator [Geobacillus]MED3747593.1 Crp/Fnr family transcriptional regulator [Geobacillus stearothermophilus]MED3752229.1 Crp/Fnr family transcriptional regulator [Geobacillus stearothermophilus]OQP07591.1 Crp/Fnr family transcriptional regulator [Geobacillus sp. 46C-IIa]QNU28248.1 Crp/Fnr family transcriptional regulator [Geobacillus sp. 46C-IIa]
MDDKRKARIRIGELLNICRKCPYGGHRNGSRYVKQCGTCDVYEEMRELGDWLANTSKRRKNRGIKKWTEEERRILIDNVHLPVRELAKMLNRRVSSVKNQIDFLKRKGLL